MDAKAGTIPLMTASEPNQEQNGNEPQSGNPSRAAETGFLLRHTEAESRSWLPWIVASAVIVLGLLTLLVLGHRSSSNLQSGGTGMAPSAPYAPQLPISGVEMSQASSFSGAKVTYLDGKISNTGDKTITGITVQAGFRDDLGQLAQRVAMPLALIRTREPYVDTEPVSAEPLKPGDSRDFRLIFDSVPPDWNQQYPEIRVIGVQTR